MAVPRGATPSYVGRSTHGIILLVEYGSFEKCESALVGIGRCTGGLYALWIVGV